MLCQLLKVCIVVSVEGEPAAIIRLRGVPGVLKSALTLLPMKITRHRSSAAQRLVLMPYLGSLNAAAIALLNVFFVVVRTDDNH